jgi:hypothetical protein
LQTLGVQAWFTVPGFGAENIDRVSSLSRLIETGDLKPNLRLVAAVNGQVLGRIAARREGALVRFWPPDIGTDIQDTLAHLIIRKLVIAVEDWTKCIVPTVDRLLTRPGDDLLEVGRWLGVLRECGFTELATGHIHQLLLENRVSTPRISRNPSLAIESINCADEPTLNNVYDVVRSATQNRFVDNTISASEYFAGLKRVSGGYLNPQLWKMARLVGQPVGFIAATSQLDGGDGTLSGWILDIGVIPPVRGRGLGTAMLLDVLSAFTCFPDKEVKAFIDDANTPSLALHSKFGFRRMQGRHMTYQKVLSPQNRREAPGRRLSR